MGFRTVVITSRAKLEFRFGYLVVRTDTEAIIHLSEISTLIVESTASVITVPLLIELSKNNINVVFCNEKHLPECSVVGFNGNYHQAKNIALQIHWESNRKSLLWQKIIRQKIQLQSFVAAELNNRLLAVSLLEYSNAVEVGDTSNREGHAAKAYFIGVFGSGFSRTDENDINSNLNYVYSIVLSCFTREIVSSGYLPQLGVWHKNEYNYLNLSCDFMEPFRPLVDFFVAKFCQGQFVKSEAANVFLMKVIFDGEQLSLVNAIRNYTKTLFRFLSQEIETIPQIERFWMGNDEL